MKKLVAVFIFVTMVVISVNGLSQEYFTINELREQIAGGWVNTYVDQFGRQIDVDIDVQVFGGDKVPVLKIGLPDYEEYSEVKNNPYLSVTNVKRNGGQRTVAYEMYGEKIEFDRVYGDDYGNNLTPGEAFGFLKNHLESQKISSESFEFDTPKSFQVLCNTSQDSGEVISAPFYFFRLWPKLYDMPLLTHVMASFNKPGWPDYTPELTYMVRNENEYAISVSTFEEKEMIEEDIPLCSFEKIIESIAGKIEAGYIQNVVSLRFGYAVYNDPNIQSKKPVSIYDAEYCYAVPSWVLECKFVDNPQKDYSDSTTTRCIAINAQTGKMLDPFDKSKFGHADGDYKGCISWDKVK